VTLEQTPQGDFSDEELVPVHVVVPNPQGQGTGGAPGDDGRPG